MAKNNEKPLTLNQLVRYNKEVLFPFMKENFVTKKEFESFTEIVAMKDDLKEVEKRVDKKLEGIATKEDIKSLSKKLDSLNDNLVKNNKLETRVADIENVLNMPSLNK